MHHIALDRARADDCHFNHYIVKTFRLHSRQGRHLRTALDLKNADRVGLLHDLKRGSVILWNMSKIERAPALTAQFKRILHHRHHAQPEQIDLHDTKVFAIVLVPLRNNPSRHGRIFQRHKGAEFVLTDDHPAGMLTKMTRQSVDRSIQIDECRHAWMRFWQTGLLDLRFQLERVWKISARKQM